MTVHVHGDYIWYQIPGSHPVDYERVCECGYSPDRPAWRVIVTGSRSLADSARVRRALGYEYAYARSQGLRMVVVEGQCPYGGADLFAQQWAERRKAEGLQVDHDPIPANWAALGKRAGPYRNQVMADRGGDVCLAFPTADSRGTRDMITRAEAAGIPTKVLEQ